MNERGRGLVVNVDGDALWYLSNMTQKNYGNIESLKRRRQRYAF